MVIMNVTNNFQNCLLKKWSRYEDNRILNGRIFDHGQLIAPFSLLKELKHAFIVLRKPKTHDFIL